MRLGFSVAIQVDADVLLVDEVLAVGDAAFQQKCFEEFQRLKAEGRTILFVTHDMGLVERFCDRAMLLERGRVLQMGDPARSRASTTRSTSAAWCPSRRTAWTGRHTPAEITACWFEVGRRAPSDLAQGEPLEIVTEVRFNEAVEDPVFAVSLRNDVGHTVFATSTQWREQRTGRFEAGEVRSCASGSTPGSGPAATRHARRWRAPGRRQHARPARGPGVVRSSTDTRDGGLIDPPLTFERRADHHVSAAAAGSPAAALVGDCAAS